MDASTQDHITFLNDYVSGTGNAGSTWSVYASNRTDTPWATVDLSSIRERSYGIGETIDKIVSAGYVKILPPKTGREEKSWSGFHMEGADQQRCIGTQGPNTTTLVNTGLNPLTVGTATATAWANTTIGRIAKVNFVAAAAIDTATSVTAQNSGGTRDLFAWTGDTAGKGGFSYYAKVALVDVNAAPRSAYGMFSTTAHTNNIDPSVNANSINSLYIGNDAAQTTLRACANGNGAGASTCTDLGANFPARTDGAIYEIWINAPIGTGSRNGGTTYPAYYRVHRVDTSVADATGAFPTGSNLPLNTTALGPAVWLNTGTAATAQTLGFVNMCVWATP
jgi:hypothetical protein